VASLLLNLRGVPDDEADEIRALLEAREIAYFETPPSRWGVSAGAIWIRRRDDVARAERLIAEYQTRRLAAARAQYHAARQQGRARTLWASVREDPLLAIAVLLGITFVIGILALPFILLGA